MPESVEAAWVEFWNLHDWAEDGGEELVNAAVRAEERNRLLNPSDELVEAVERAMKSVPAGVSMTREYTYPDIQRMARAALHAAGQALDSGSAG